MISTRLITELQLYVNKSNIWISNVAHKLSHSERISLVKHFKQFQTLKLIWGE